MNIKKLNYIYSIFAILFIISTKTFGVATILISAGGTVSVNNGDLFYDAGGVGGVDGNTNYTITLTPAVAGDTTFTFITLRTPAAADVVDESVQPAGAVPIWELMVK